MENEKINYSFRSYYWIQSLWKTESIENAIIYNKVLNKEIDQIEYRNTCSKLKQTLKEFGKYPNLPLDENNQVH